MSEPKTQAMSIRKIAFWPQTDKSADKMHRSYQQMGYLHFPLVHNLQCSEQPNELKE